MTAVSPSNADSAPALDASMLSASLTVSDLPASVAWYRDVLGLTVTREFERDGVLFAVSLLAGAVPVLLTRDDGAKGQDRAKGEGISLRFTTSTDIDALAARAKSAGAVLDSEPMDGFGARFFRVRDPDGFRLVVSSKQKPAG